MLLKPSHLLHHHLLRRPGDLCQKVHEVFLVHPAAVVGKGIETALHTERQQDAALGVVGEGGVLRGQALPQTLFDAVGKDALTGIGKEDVHRRFVLDKGPEQLTGQHLRPDRVQLHCRDAGQDVGNELVLQPVGQCIDILIMGIERRFVHAGQCAQVFDLDLFQRHFAAQFQKRFFDGAVGLFDADVQK